MMFPAALPRTDGVRGSRRCSRCCCPGCWRPPVPQQEAQEVDPLRHLRRVAVAPVRAELHGVHLGHGLAAGADGRHVGGEVVVVRDLDDEGVALLLPVDDLAPVDADAGCEPLPLMTVEYDMNINQTST